MIIPPIVIERLQDRSGINFMTASDRELNKFLDNIHLATGYPIGLNTFKRMIGKISDHDHQPRQSTLNVFARYLGMSDWDELMRSATQGDSSFDTVEGEVRACDLTLGSRVELTYLPDRLLQLVKVADDMFEVSKSVNSKLMPGDCCRLASFVRNYPLIVAEVVRNGESLGSYTAARSGGIKQLSVELA